MYRILSAMLGPLLFLAVPLRAQNESGTRPLDSAHAASERVLFDSSTKESQVMRPIMVNIPPIHAGRPSSINLFYARLDSLLRSLPTDVLVASIEAAITTDTACQIIKDLFEVVDYDPLLFRQYMVEVQLNARHRIVTNLGDTVWRGRYLADLGDVWQAVLQRYCTMHRSQPGGLARFSLLAADLVVRIHVASVDSLPDRPGTTSMAPNHLYRVRYTMVDTLKGRPIWTYVNAEEKFEGASPVMASQGEAGQSVPPVWHYCTYHTMTYPTTSPAGMAGLRALYPVRDTNLAKGLRQTLRLEAGKDYIVFLRFVSPLLDGMRDYFRLAIRPDACMGALLVDATTDTVHDPNRVFGTTATYPYSTFLASLAGHRSVLASTRPG